MKKFWKAKKIINRLRNTEDLSKQSYSTGALSPSLWSSGIMTRKRKIIKNTALAICRNIVRKYFNTLFKVTVRIVP